MEIASALVFGLPAGVVVPYAGSAAPAGWLLCQGQLVSRSVYAALFAAIGTAYGVGDGSTTFGLPDLRGRVVAGVDGGAGRLSTAFSGGMGSVALAGVGGEEAHVDTLTETNAHAHTIDWNQVTNTATTGAANRVAVIVGASGGTNTNSTAAVGGGAAHNNVQPTIVLNYMIATGGP